MTTKRININGIVTYWTTSEVNLVKLRERLIAAEPGLANLIPEAATPMNALREALQAAYPKMLVRALKRKGFAVVREDRGQEANEYDSVAAVWLEGESLVFDNNCNDCDAIRRKYDAHRGILQPSQAGSLLAKIIGDYLGGTMLRPKTGGIYWLPDNQGERYAAIAAAFEYAGEGGATVYTIRHMMDEEACKAVHDAIIHEMNLEAARLNEDIAGGKMGDKALASRQREADALMAKVANYEAMLDTDLAGARKALGDAKDAAASAQLLAAAAKADETAEVANV